MTKRTPEAEFVQSLCVFDELCIFVEVVLALEGNLVDCLLEGVGVKVFVSYFVYLPLILRLAEVTEVAGIGDEFFLVTVLVLMLC